jgi:hypothetical protein
MSIKMKAKKMNLLKIDVKKAEENEPNEESKINFDELNGNENASKQVFSQISDQVFISGKPFP